MPKFSVIIPAYNREKYIREAIDSVLSQTFTDYELIVCDDGSTDSTQEIIASYGSRIKFTRSERVGAGGARNAAAKLAGGEYLTFLDSDDIMLPWALGVADRLLRDHPRLSFISSSYKHFADGEKMAECAFEAPAVEVFSDMAELGWVGTGVWAAIRRDVFEAHKGFVEGVATCEDMDLCLRMGNVPNVANITAPVCLRIRRHESHLTGDASSRIRGLKVLLRAERLGKYPCGGVISLRQSKRRFYCGVYGISLRTLNVHRSSQALFLYYDIVIRAVWYRSIGVRAAAYDVCSVIGRLIGLRRNGTTALPPTR